MEHRRLFLIFFIILTSLVTSCNYPGSLTTASSGPQAWIDAPLDGSTIPWAPYEIVAHGGGSNISALEIRINGEIVFSLSNPSSDEPLITSNYTWQPLEPGRYLLQARTQNSAGIYSDYAEATVFVGEKPETPTDIPVTETAPTQTPAPTICNAAVTLTEEANCRQGPNLGYRVITTRKEGVTLPVEGRNIDATWWWVLLPGQDAHCWISDWIVETSCISEDVPFITSAPLISEINASTNTFFWGDCDLRKVTISATILDESGLTGASIHYRLAKKTGNATSKWISTALEQTSENIWAITIISHDLPGYADLSEAWLEYYITAANSAGLTSQSETYKNITLKKCE
jgi:hypothetical protein